MQCFDDDRTNRGPTGLRPQKIARAHSRCSTKQKQSELFPNTFNFRNRLVAKRKSLLVHFQKFGRDGFFQRGDPLLVWEVEVVRQAAEQHNVDSLAAARPIGERQGVKRIDTFLAQPERVIPEECRRESPRGDVVLSHVTFGYDERAVLSDLSFTVKSGEQVTLVGRTGAGKSTVFRLLLGLYKPEKGALTIGGVDVSDITDGERRGCIGCVEQHFARVPGTVVDQITLGDRRITRERAEKAAHLAGLDGVIRSFPQGYDTPCSDGMFSQGEWQLLSIARAAAADPAVLLLDEITANLDAETEARVMEALRRASEGRTVLSISHRVYETLGGRTIRIGEEA